jgi:hypothetical protein
MRAPTNGSTQLTLFVAERTPSIRAAVNLLMRRPETGLSGTECDPESEKTLHLGRAAFDRH